MLNGNGSWNTIPAGGGTVRADNNGTYTAQVRAVTSADGSTYASDASAPSNAVSPYGPPKAPGTSASGGDRQVSFSWSDPGRNGRDYRVQINTGGGWQDVAPSGSTQVPAGYSEQKCFSARTVDSTGAITNGQDRCDTSKPEPINTSVSISKGGDAQGEAGCAGSACRYVNISISDGKPNATYTIRYRSSMDNRDWLTFTMTTNGSGNVSQTRGYWGYPNQQVWAVASGPDGTFESNHINW